MKKAGQIAFIFLALLFGFKSLAVLFSSSKTPAFYTVDISENESSEKGEKEDPKEKEIFEEGRLNNQDVLLLNFTFSNGFENHNEIWHYRPYFEVCSPPPELG